MHKIYGIIKSVVIKKESEIILINKLKHCTKEILKLLTIFTIAFFIIITIVFIKYNPIYEVRLNGETIGYVKSITVMEDIINTQVLTSDNPCAVFTTLNIEPTYELKLSARVETNEEEIAHILSENTTTLYRVYALTINDEEKSYVNTLDEAEQIVNEMKQEYPETVAKVSILEEYTENIDSIGVAELSVAKSSIDTNLRQIKDEQARIAASTLNGVYFAVKPVANGTITSRYGVVESSIRDHAHGGTDIAAPYGTDIKAAADGTVTYSGEMGGYGNLIIIDHGNGVQTYYGHCSKLYASVGDTVVAGDVIAAVGSTGNSTGNHLHLEIRLNGSTVNPQKYIYN